VRDLAPELALATLPGDERAAALVHLERCAECRLVVEELADVADALLLLTPEADPPMGFARRVVAGFAPRRAPRSRSIVAVAAAAAALVAVTLAAVTGVVGHGSGSSRPPFALQAPGVQTARFLPARGERVQGQVFSYAGHPSWVFMTVHDEGSSDTYRCELELADGQRLEVGSFQLHGGAGSWGRAIPVDVHQVQAVRLINERGALAATASLA
jgi:hypothetical protein